MNVNASKVMLGVALAAYGYCSWGYIFPDKIKLEAPGAAKELTAAVVDRRFDCDIVRDPFGSSPLERGAVATGALGGPQGHILGDLTLNAIILMPMERVALINGKEVRQGQTVTFTDKGPPVYAQKVGEDFVVLEAVGEITMLRLETSSKASPTPTAAHAGAGRKNYSVTMGQ